ncbi:hypothetical protein PVAND_009420 [Polypedilum vanderplanki]|uniref:Arrestin C-terminal-like domain-containing protein n=1 Tax=Polypedilum vanderplanki TaxID=319348 RepID=A0A9J6CDN3_POLVA|nr:hypothetical protein PVAND_009420 [Polypedilum vanderplanki]
MAVRCAIIFNGNNDNFKSGEMITGIIEIVLNEKRSLRHLMVTIEGNGEVKWPSLTFSDNGVHSQFTNSEQYFKESIHIFGCSDQLYEEEIVYLDSGIHVYPFSYELPLNLPSSFHGSFGSINYVVTAVVDTLDCNITVVRPFQISNESLLHDVSKFPFVAEVSSEFCFCFFWNAKPLFMAASISHSGYETGDDISVTIELVNRSRVSIMNISVELVQVIIYKSKAPKEHRKVDEKILVKSNGPYVGREKSRIFTSKLAIPNFIPPTQRHACQMIEIHYRINVRLAAQFHQIIRLHPSLTLPITIGIRPNSKETNVGTTAAAIAP